MTESNSSIAQTFKAGDKLAGCFVLKEILPLGNLGVVWLAHDEELNKDLALHFVPDSVAADTRAMSELKQEAKRNRQLIHPRIVRVYDLLEDEKWAAVSMDYIKGDTLAALQEKKSQRAFNPGEVSGWISDLCQTLEDAHRVDLYHRDLAPENLLATANGLMVLKFGIARVILDSLARSGQKLEGGRDIAFMSPQQLDGERPSREDDIFSLGAVVYHLLTGVLPYGDGDLVSNIRKAVPARVSERRAALKIQGEPIPASWDKTIAACLEKTRDARPNRASEVAAGFSAPTGASTTGATTVAAAVAATAAAATAAVEMAEEKAAAPKAEEKAKPKPEEKTKESGPESADATKQQKRAWGPAKTPVITEATVLSKTSVSKSEKSEAPAAAAAAGGERKAAASNPTTPSGFPLRAFVDVDGESKGRGSNKPPVALIATAGVLGLLLVIGYLVSRNSGSPSPGSPEAVVAETSSTNSEIRPASNEAAPPAAEASIPPANEPVNLAAASVPLATAPVPSRTPAAATPVPAVAEAPSPTATPVAVAAHTPVSPALAAGGILPKNLDEAKAALAAAEKEAQAKAAAQAQALAAAKEVQQAIQAKNDAAAAAKKAADATAATLAQQQAAVQKADAEAADAQKQAAAKTQAADALHKTLQDAQTGAKKQQAAQQQAAAEAAEMSKMAAQRQQQADAAAKAAADAEAARAKQSQTVQRMESDLAQQQAAAEKARKAEEAERAAQEAARIKQQQLAAQEAARIKQQQLAAQQAALLQQQQQRAAEAQRLAAQAAVAAKAAEDAEKALATAKKAVEDAEKARAHAEEEAAAARSGAAMPLASPMPATTPPAAMMASPAPAASPAGAAPTITVHAPNPHSQVDATLGNSLGMRFAPVGNVLFSVWLTRVQDFEAFAKATGFKPTAWRQPGFKQGPDHPVVNVSWNEAMQFCLWLTEKEHRDGILALNETYRLPNDLEWSKAVGLAEEGGRTPESRDMDVPDVYPWGTQWPPPAGAGNYTGEETDSDVAIKGYNDGFAWTSPVGSFGANKLGLYDMGGNVWQWCLDWWNPEQKAKVLRGGSWYNGALKLSLLSSCRIHAGAESETDNYGFRVVISQETTKPKAAKRH